MVGEKLAEHHNTKYSCEESCDAEVGMRIFSKCSFCDY